MLIINLQTKIKMSTTALQLQNTTAESFKSEIVQDIKEYFNDVLKTIATSDTETYLSRQDVGNLLNVSLVTVWSWTNKGVKSVTGLATK